MSKWIKEKNKRLAGIRGLGSAGDLQSHQAKGAQSISGKVHPCGRRTYPRQVWSGENGFKRKHHNDQGCHL